MANNILMVSGIGVALFVFYTMSQGSNVPEVKPPCYMVQDNACVNVGNVNNCGSIPFTYTSMIGCESTLGGGGGLQLCADYIQEHQVCNQIECFIDCTDEYDPVCADGNTYSNACYACANSPLNSYMEGAC